MARKEVEVMRRINVGRTRPSCEWTSPFGSGKGDGMKAPDGDGSGAAAVAVLIVVLFLFFALLLAAATAGKARGDEVGGTSAQATCCPNDSENGSPRQ